MCSNDSWLKCHYVTRCPFCNTHHVNFVYRFWHGKRAITSTQPLVNDWFDFILIFPFTWKMELENMLFTFLSEFLMFHINLSLMLSACGHLLSWRFSFFIFFLVFFYLLLPRIFHMNLNLFPVIKINSSSKSALWLQHNISP